MSFRVFQHPLPAAPDLVELNNEIASQRGASVLQYKAAVTGGSLLVTLGESIAVASRERRATGALVSHFRTDSGLRGQILQVADSRIDRTATPQVAIPLTECRP